ASPPARAAAPAHGRRAQPRGEASRMIGFALAAAGLAALVLVLVLRPFLTRRAGSRVSRRAANIAVYKDELRELDADLAAGTLAREDYERARLELESRLLEDVPRDEAVPVRGPGKGAAWTVGIAVPVVAAVVYLATGSPGALAPGTAAPDVAQVEAMVARLAAKLRENPGDIEGWKLLGRSYSARGRFPE